MSNNSKITQAVILAGGQGKRLRPLTNTTPKPMVLVNNFPFSRYLVDYLKGQGIEEVIFLLGYMPSAFKEYFGDGRSFGVHIKYSHSDTKANSFTRLKNAQSLLADQFVLCYGDIYYPIDVPSAARHFHKYRRPAQITAYTNHDGWGEYGKKNNLLYNADCLVTNYAKQRPSIKNNGLDIGFIMMKRSLIRHVPSYYTCLWRHFIPHLIKKQQLSAYPVNNHYYTITNQKWLNKTKELLK